MTLVAGRSLTFIVVLTVARVVSAGEGRIVYFDPDANHQAIVNTISLFNDFLNEANLGLVFQPVSTASSLHDLVAGNQAEFAILSANVLRNSKSLNLAPILVPSSGGDIYYRKSLVDAGGGTPDDLEGKGVAVTVSGGDTASAAQQILEGLRNAGHHVKSISVIPVSKDVDALLALSFGQVAAALVTDKSVEVLKRINPSAAAGLRTIFQTQPILRSPLCSVGAVSIARKKQLSDAFKKMAASRAGGRAMQTMGFDQWTDFEGRMLTK
ncbi:MAG: PhnD/SsuA/transferrin family substrate-binding protein [Deltaproteobacteria bacterium]|nr:PhnD/SsuA/transferrin family substrate-binding protein [Deltaproteobacteria bacterium]